MKNWIQDLTQVLDNLSKIADKNQSKHQSSYFYQYGINKILERKKIFIKIMILDLLRKKWKGLIYGGSYVKLKSFSLVPKKCQKNQFSAKRFQFRAKNIQFSAKKLQFRAKKYSIYFQKKKFKISAKKNPKNN